MQASQAIDHNMILRYTIITKFHSRNDLLKTLTSTNLSVKKKQDLSGPIYKKEKIAAVSR